MKISFEEFDERVKNALKTLGLRYSKPVRVKYPHITKYRIQAMKHGRTRDLGLLETIEDIAGIKHN